MNKCEDLEGNAFQEGNAELEIYEQKHTWLVDQLGAVLLACNKATDSDVAEVLAWIVTGSKLAGRRLRQEIVRAHGQNSARSPVPHTNRIYVFSKAKT
jgi:hypothetical protein